MPLWWYLFLVPREETREETREEMLMISSLDKRRLKDAADALALKEPKTLREMEAQLPILWDALTAMQSTENLGSREAENQAWADMLELQRRAEALEKKIKRLKAKQTGKKKGRTR